jgi:hypothetical protein
MVVRVWGCVTVAVPVSSGRAVPFHSDRGITLLGCLRPGHEHAESEEAAEQCDAADEAFGGTVASTKVPPHARAGRIGRGHRFAADRGCSTDMDGSAGRNEASRPR